jgi:hypothetical protein
MVRAGRKEKEPPVYMEDFYLDYHLIDLCSDNLSEEAYA